MRGAGHRPVIEACTGHQPSYRVSNHYYPTHVNQKARLSNCWISVRPSAHLSICPQAFCFFLLSTSLGKAVMPAIGFQDLPLNIYVVVFGTGVFAFILSLIFCCYLIRLRRQAQSELYGYKEVILKGKAKKLSLQEQTCAVCLEDFKEKDELAVCPCKHAFHRKCLVKWLEIRNSCPMCNKAVAQHVEQTPVNAVTQGEELV